MISICELINKYTKNIIDITNNSIDNEEVVISGKINKINRYYDKCYFDIFDKDCKINCVSNGMYDELIKCVNNIITVKGNIRFTYNKTFKNYNIQLIVKEIIGISECKNISIDKKYLTHKEINWDNVKRIALLSKYNTHGYNDFITQTVDKFNYDIISIDLYEIVLEGNGVEKSLIETINSINSINKDNNKKDNDSYDVIIICRGGGDTNSISNSFDKENIFNAIKNSKIPIATCIGHSDDKDDKLLITSISDYDFTTPTEAGRFIFDIYKKNVNDMITDAEIVICSYANDIIESIEDDIKKYYENVNEIKEMLGVNNIIEIKDIESIISYNGSYYKIRRLESVNGNYRIIQDIFNDFNETREIDIDKLINNVSDVNVIRKCCQLKEFIIKKNIKECFMIYDEMKNDKRKFMFDNGLVNKEIIKCFEIIDKKI